MGTKREAKAAAPSIQPIDRHALDAALRLFVASFVVVDKRKQMHDRLLTAERRGETLGTVLRWITGIKAPLEGADRSPAGLHARFGELSGIHLDEVGARRTTIASALELGRGKRSLFIGDTGRVALVTDDVGTQTLCSRVG
ncbi:MAG: hypothetical protein H0T89_11200 [Deltaproteobacteria bacterium]|nr:hypothetical protein [Deltaproteobacteria bacterium]MDQ3295958.1 hypothetical protein [Myxococcota bacterium]